MNSKYLGTGALALLLGLGLGACDDGGASDGGEGAEAGASMDGDDSDSAPPTDDDGDDDDGPITGDGDGDGDDCGSFLGCPDDDDGGAVPSCDIWAQDCEGEEKCSPVASTPGSGSWDATVCVPVGDAPPGSACTRLGGPLDGDTCDAAGMCFDIDADTGVGTCVEICGGTQATPTCEQSGASTSCKILNQGVLPLCLEDCNPLLGGECPPGRNCTAAFEGQTLDGFICFPPAGEGASGAECACANCCSSGHMCVGAAAFGPDCGFDGCCTEYCDVGEAGFSCSGAGQNCVALFEPGTPVLGQVGVCQVPM